MEKYFVVKYSGQFGFIKPWTAVRDSETFSQQFLTPSIVEGIEKKLFPELLNTQGIHKIKRHKLTYQAISKQTEVTQTRGFKVNKKEKYIDRPTSILTRGVLLNPDLFLAFSNKEDAEIASRQHICLCRNEDILLPSGIILELTEEEFSQIDGFELRFGESKNSFMVGYNRFDNVKEMYGWLEVSDNPLKNTKYEL